MALRNAGLLAVGLFTAIASWSVADEPVTRVEIARRGKAATALVDVKPNYGSAFCIHPSGVYITNEHVVRDAGDKEIKLVLNSGTASQRVLTAKVARADKELDLAVLHVADAKDLPSLSLGTDEDLTELQDVVALGFPFGTALAQKDEYPAISLNAGTITSLRNGKNKALNRIQLDAAVNPGNSGGPVLDDRARVVGVVATGVIGTGVNLAIPVSHLRQIVSKPDIIFTPPTIAKSARGEPAEFQAKVVSLLESTENLSLELRVRDNAGAERRLPMELADGVYLCRAVPFPGATASVKVQMDIGFANGTISGSVEDRTFEVGGRALKLSEVVSLSFSDSPTAATASEKVSGKISGLDEVQLELGGQSITVQLATARTANLASTVDEHMLECTVVASGAAGEVARKSVELYVEGSRQPSFELLRAGKFIRPGRASSPTTYLKAASSKGDYIGGGKDLTYEGPALKPTGNDRFITVNVDGWHIAFSAARGGALKAEEYSKAKRHPFNDDAPGISFSGHGRGCNQISGKFVIWELESENDQIKKLAIDFVQNCENTMPPLVGMLRFNSSFR